MPGSSSSLFAKVLAGHLKTWLGRGQKASHMAEARRPVSHYRGLDIWLLTTQTITPQSKWSRRKPPSFYELALEVTNHHFCHIPLVTQATLIHEKKLHKGVNTRSQGPLGTLFIMVYNSDKHTDTWLIWCYMCTKILWHFSHQKGEARVPLLLNVCCI